MWLFNCRNDDNHTLWRKFNWIVWPQLRSRISEPCMRLGLFSRLLYLDASNCSETIQVWTLKYWWAVHCLHTFRSTLNRAARSTISKNSDNMDVSVVYPLFVWVLSAPQVGSESGPLYRILSMRGPVFSFHLRQNSSLTRQVRVRYYPCETQKALWPIIYICTAWRVCSVGCIASVFFSLSVAFHTAKSGQTHSFYPLFVTSFNIPFCRVLCLSVAIVVSALASLYKE